MLTGEIADTLAATAERDFVFAVSVQAHGQIPDNRAGGTEEDPGQRGRGNLKEQHFEYYVNQIHEVDAFLGELTANLADYPEPVVLVMYGGHLPSTEYQAERLKKQ